MKKKEYTKPLIKIEAFALSQSIAKACGYDSQTGTTVGKPNHADIDTCAWLYEEEDEEFGDVESYSFWLDASPKCTDAVGYDFDFGGFCYNNPNGGVAVFSSL